MYRPAKFKALALLLPIVIGLAGGATAQTAVPLRVGDVFRQATPPAGWTFLGTTCKETFSVCANVLRRGGAFYLLQTKPMNYRPGQPLLSERVIRVTPYTAKAGETTGWNCYIDNQSPILVFVRQDRRSARAIVLDRTDNYVEVERRLAEPNWCEFDAGE